MAGRQREEIVEESECTQPDKSNINGRYHRSNVKVGKGGFKEVFKAFDTHEQIDVAWNQIDLSVIHSEEEKKRILKECEMLRRLNHPNILKITDQWFNDKTDKLCFITNIVHDGSLAKFFRKRQVNLLRVKQICKQVLAALHYLHAMGVIHRDLKCDNIFIEGNTGKAVLGDLGLSCNVVSARSIVGTPHWMAPELYREEYDEMVDIWSFGMCVLELITSVIPYAECKGAFQVYTNISSGKKPEVLKKINDPYVRAFINISLDVNAAMRPSAAELLEHPFLLERPGDTLLCSQLMKPNARDKEPEPDEEEQKCSKRARRARLSVTKCSKPKCSSQPTIGLSVGGAKDVNSYRQSLEANLVPSAGALTFNGLLSEYYFDTKTRAFSRQIADDGCFIAGRFAVRRADDGSRLFYPSFCCAKSRSASTGAAEYYLSVGLNSNLKRSEFSRKRLNLLIVADISGSMSSRMGAASAKTKMEVCNESVVALLSHLRVDDRFAMVTFDHRATLLHEFERFGAYDRDALQSSILALRTDGGTDFECGFAAATNAFEALFASAEFTADDGEFDNRIIFLTDAIPNHGRRDEHSLFSMVSKAANASSVRARIFSTFVGIGIDFNAALIESISATRGCNYFSVKSAREFGATMDAEFELMVTPLVFNVSLRVVCEGNAVRIAKVFGATPKKERAILENGEVTRIDTLFPARKRPQSEGGAVKGGIQLIRLETETADNEEFEGDDAKSERDVNVQIEVTFEDRNGREFRNAQTVSFAPPQLSELDNGGDMRRRRRGRFVICELDKGGDGDDEPDEGFFDNDSIRKGVLLCRYAEAMMRWMDDTPRGDLKINATHKAALSAFAPHFEREMKRCADEELQREMDILHKLLRLDATEY